MSGNERIFQLSPVYKSQFTKKSFLRYNNQEIHGLPVLPHPHKPHIPNPTPTPPPPPPLRPPTHWPHPAGEYPSLELWCGWLEQWKEWLAQCSVKASQGVILNSNSELARGCAIDIVFQGIFFNC